VKWNIDATIATGYLEKQFSAGDSLAVLLQRELPRISQCFYFSEEELGPLNTVEQLSASIGLSAQQVRASSQSVMLHIRDNRAKDPESLFIVEGNAVTDRPSEMDAPGLWFVTHPSIGGIWEPPDYSTKRDGYATYCYDLPSSHAGDSLPSVLRNARRYPLVGALGARPRAWAASAGVPLQDVSVLGDFAASATFVLTDAFDGEIELLFELS
jgi:hypothetical protein